MLCLLSKLTIAAVPVFSWGENSKISRESTKQSLKRANGVHWFFQLCLGRARRETESLIGRNIPSFPYRINSCLCKSIACTAVQYSLDQSLSPPSCIPFYYDTIKAGFRSPPPPLIWSHPPSLLIRKMHECIACGSCNLFSCYNYIAC